MSRHVKSDMSFEEGQKQKELARDQKIAFLNSLSSDEINELNKSAKESMDKIISNFKGYEV